MTAKLRPLPSIQETRQLMAVASGRLPADLAVVSGNVVDVFTGETRPANLAVKGGRIAYAGRTFPCSCPS